MGVYGVQGMGVGVYGIHDMGVGCVAVMCVHVFVYCREGDNGTPVVNGTCAVPPPPPPPC